MARRPCWSSCSLRFSSSSGARSGLPASKSPSTPHDADAHESAGSIGHVRRGARMTGANDAAQSRTCIVPQRTVHAERKMQHPSLH
eukprot:886890-Pleurochrysis_carterae.AAC.1